MLSFEELGDVEVSWEQHGEDKSEVNCLEELISLLSVQLAPIESSLDEELGNLVLEEQVVLTLTRTHQGVRLLKHLPDELLNPLTFLVKVLLHLLDFGLKLLVVILRRWYVLLLGFFELGSLFGNVPIDEGIDLLRSWRISSSLVDDELLSWNRFILRVFALWLPVLRIQRQHYNLMMMMM